MVKPAKSFVLFVEQQRSNPFVVLDDVQAVNEYLGDVHGVPPSRIHLMLEARKYFIITHREDGEQDILKIHMPVWMVEYLQAALDHMDSLAVE